ncbi:XPG domain containing-domain-containing protein [Aspergillus cavernicola]|uniref:XPG domain containing-domain-containing protein n=1 Tax=Aspergillus cavernicola TaxID=176166 RepID=A0ABR4J3B6_9EURO
MGIPRLRHHLLPFSQTVLLQGKWDPREEDIACIQSVVIDGPSLVYNVYSRLLSWFAASSSNMIDTLPTCDEVSRGVMLYLLHLKILGVDIKNIYFDGALPAPKHETRVVRLESQRRKLELFCSVTKDGFGMSRSRSDDNRTVGPENVLRSRPSPARYCNVPANPFMVSAVFEDLKYRWNGESISRVTAGVLASDSLDLGPDFPWANLTAMVPGEADAYCAYAARLTDSCILTNDSDLLLYDLGSCGSVIFLDSVEINGRDSIQPSQFKISAAMLHPSLVAQRLGVPSLLSLAYQLKAQPEIGLVELLRRSRNDIEMVEHLKYRQFLEDYQIDHCPVRAQETNQPREILDTRISELFWQYELRGEYTAWDCPRMYLPILNENHAKRCAWAKGRLYREVGYSILNNSRPINERHRYVIEFIRRGQRIAEDRILLRNENWIWEQARSLAVRLRSFQTYLRKDSSPLEFWTLFALRDSYGADAEFTQDDIRKLNRFLRLGYMGKRFEWADIHLTAEIQAGLYSLRILKQLIGFLITSDALVIDLRAALEGLPPLHIMINSARQGLGPCATGILTSQLPNIFGHLSEETQPHANETARQESPDPSTLVSIIEKDNVDTMPSHKILFNRYNLLQEQ